MGDFGLALPVVRINRLSQSTESGECWRLSDMGDLILNAVRKPIVENVMEGALAITTDLGG
jgi:hypothetical protein